MELACGDGLTICIAEGFQAERTARTKVLNGNQYLEKPVFEFCTGGG